MRGDCGRNREQAPSRYEPGARSRLGLALTSRTTSSGADVTLTPPGNGGNGFASQRWIGNAGGPMIAFQNVKTGPFLRVRNGGPIMHQTVTTGSTFTVWLMF